MSTPFNITSDYLLKSGKRPIHAGDDYNYAFQVKRAGVALNLSGSCTIWFTVKDNANDSDAEAKLQYSSADATEIEITDGAGGRFTLYLKSEDTAELYGFWQYDIKAKLATTKIIRLAYGVFEFLPNITQAE